MSGQNDQDMMQQLTAKLALLAQLTNVPPEFPLAPAEAAILLGRSVKQLAEDRHASRGPRFIQPNGANSAVFYPIGALRDFLKGQKLYGSTHEAKIAAEEALLTRFDQLFETSATPDLLLSASTAIELLGTWRGRDAIAMARGRLPGALVGLRSRKSHGGHLFPASQLACFVQNEPVAVLDGTSSLRAQRLAAVAEHYANTFDEALLSWINNDVADEEADLLAFAAQTPVSTSVPLKRRTPGL